MKKSVFLITLLLSSGVAGAQDVSDSAIFETQQVKNSDFSCPKAETKSSMSLAEIYTDIETSTNCETATQLAIGCRTNTLADALLARTATQSCLPVGFRLSSEAQKVFRQEQGACSSHFSSSDGKQHIQKTQCVLFAARKARRINDSSFSTSLNGF